MFLVLFNYDYCVICVNLCLMYRCRPYLSEVTCRQSLLLRLFIVRVLGHLKKITHHAARRHSGSLYHISAKSETNSCIRRRLVGLRHVRFTCTVACVLIVTLRYLSSRYLTRCIIPYLLVFRACMKTRLTSYSSYCPSHDFPLSDYIVLSYHLSHATCGK